MSAKARILGTLGSIFFGLIASLATAQPRDEYGEMRQTVARISFLSGPVSFSRGDDPEDWQPADRNVPMTLGDRIYTGSRSRMELQVHGGDFVRLGPRTDFAALNLTDDTKQFSLRSGVASIRIRRLSDYEVFEIDTPNAAVTFDRPGAYRVDVDEDGFTRVSVRSGSATVAAGGGEIALNAGEEMDIDGIDEPRYDIVDLARPDSWDRWVSLRDDRRNRTRSYRYVNSDIVGAEDLDDYGRWDQVPNYGWAWSPTSVSADWAPYRSGHWIWQDPWGWTWVSTEPWGWAPYHYGRWTRVSSRWYWVPVAPAVRYVDYSPALVAFVGGGPGWSASISIGSTGFVGWFPLGPRDSFSPWWGDRSRRDYSNVRGNVAYDNRTYITVVNRNTFVSGGVVAGNIVRDQAVVRQIGAAPVLAGPIPVAPTRASLHVAARADAPAALEPPAATISRMVVARTAPPPAPPTFQAKLPVISQNSGAPVAPADAARISVESRGRPQAVTNVRPVAEQPGQVTLAPKETGPGQAAPRRAAPVTANRGRPMATSQQPVSNRPVNGPAGTAGAPPPIAPAPPERPAVEPIERGRPAAPPPAAAPGLPPGIERRRAVPPETPVPAPNEIERPRRERPPDEIPPGLRRREQPTPVPQPPPPPPQPNLERQREQPTPVPAPNEIERPRRERPPNELPPGLRRREQPTPVPQPPPPPQQPNLERQREVPAPAPPREPPGVERGRGRERPTPVPPPAQPPPPPAQPAPPPAQDVRPGRGRGRDAAPAPEVTRAPNEPRQPVQRGRAVTPTPEGPKGKKDKQDKNPD